MLALPFPRVVTLPSYVLSEPQFPLSVIVANLDLQGAGEDSVRMYAESSLGEGLTLL